METTREQAEATALAERLRKDYMETRVLDDGSVAAVGDLLYTRAIYLGMTDLGWARRFCFEDRALALTRFAELKSEDDEPEGYTARRGE